MHVKNHGFSLDVMVYFKVQIKLPVSLIFSECYFLRNSLSKVTISTTNCALNVVVRWLRCYRDVLRTVYADVHIINCITFYIRFCSVCKCGVLLLASRGESHVVFAKLVFFCLFFVVQRWPPQARHPLALTQSSWSGQGQSERSAPRQYGPSPPANLVLEWISWGMTTWRPTGSQMDPNLI